MSWPTLKDPVTVCDVLEHGACYDGVREWLIAHRLQIAGPSAEHAGEDFIRYAAFADGNGTGDGGYGYGNGNGYGNGYGTGTGDGGDGNGYGYGTGNGTGDGGYGDGGYGDG